MKKTAAKGHTKKHTGTSKHARHHAKHHPVHHPGGATAHGTKVHAVAKHPHHAKARGLAAADALPVCAAEALAMSLRLLGQRVSEDDVAELWHLTGGGEDGATVAATLLAATEYGLAGCHPVFGEVMPRGRSWPAWTHSEGDPVTRAGQVNLQLPGLKAGTKPSGSNTALIMGVDLPGPHTVLAAPDGWWSWGELHDPAEFPHTVIEECWAVVWA